MNNVLNKKPGRRLSRGALKKYICIGLLIFLSTSLAYAQTKPAVKTAPAVKAAPAPTPAISTKAAIAAPVAKPLAYNAVDYLKTPQHAARAVKYKSSLAAPYVKPLTFSDGKLTITYSKKIPANEVAGPVTKTKGTPKKTTSDGLICTETTVSLDANSTNFLSNDAAAATSNIYPGAVYTIQNLTNGTYQQQQGARNPITITCDNYTGAVSSVLVQNPNMATINTAIAQIYGGFQNKSGQVALAYQVSTTDNSAEYNLAVGAGASGYGVDIKNVWSDQSQSNHVHMTIDAMKTMFSINMVPPDNGIFQDPGIEANPYVTYIGEVSYGMRVLANVDMTFSSEAEADDFKASVSDMGFTADLSVDYKNANKSTSCSINTYVVGGPGNQVIAYSLADLKNKINQAFASATYANAVAISYQAFSMDDQVISNGSLSSQFTERNCVAANGGVPDIQDIEITFSEGGDAKDVRTPFNVVIVPGKTGDPNKNIMFDFNMPTNTKAFNNNGSDMVILTPNKNKPGAYTGQFNTTTFAKAGGGRIIICAYPPPNTGFYDIWQITGVTVNINLKPSSGSTAGAGPPPALTWTLTGPNQITLDTRSSSTNTATLYFDGNMAASGVGAQSN